MAVKHKFDALIIGCGVAGACVARELARYDLSIGVLEAANDIAHGATRANSGIVHAGYDPAPGSKKAHYSVLGSKIYPQWADELGFAYIPNGSLVIAFDQADLRVIRELVERARVNGVEGVKEITAKELRDREPNVSKNALGALYAPTGAICDPFGITLAAAENACTNGVSFFFGRKVKKIDCVARDGEQSLQFFVETDQGIYGSRIIINAAGMYSDEINNMVSEEKICITARRGEYRLYDTELGTKFSHTLFQAPSEAGKGVLLTPTVHGNLLVGPTAVIQASKDDVSTTEEGLATVSSKAKLSWPDLPVKGMIASFAGLRASGETRDFVLGETQDVEGFFNIACFDSPGLTSAPAVATDIAQQVAKRLGVAQRSDFEPRREPFLPFALMKDEQRAQAIARDKRFGRVICRCCNVTEAEVVRFLKGPLPAPTLDALKWRCGITMGRCHGGFCSPEVVRIMARETGKQPHEIVKKSPGSYLVADNRSDYVGLCHSPEKSIIDKRSLAASDFKQDTSELNTACAHKDLALSQESCIHDVVVVGGGAAGISAAYSAYKQGATHIVLLDREAHLGGILKQCIHNGFGLHRFTQELTGPEYAEREIASLRKYPIKVMLATSVLRVDAALRRGDAHTIVAVNEKGQYIIKARAVILATGSRERSIGALGIAGPRPAGVFSAGSAQNFMNLQGCLPGKQVVILGSGDIGLIMARRLASQGAKVIGVYEMLPRPSGLQRNVVQCLNDFNIPLYLSKTVTRLEGENRLSAVHISEVDRDTLSPIPGTQQRIACDTLLLSVGLIPENEIAKMAGVRIDPVTGGAIVDNYLATSVPGIYACGNALHVHDLVDYVSDEGALAGASASHYIQSVSSLSRAVDGINFEVQQQSETQTIPITVDASIRYVVPQSINTNIEDDADIVISFRVAKPLQKPRFLLEGINSQEMQIPLKTMKTVVALPSEMVQIKLKGRDISHYKEIVLRAEIPESKAKISTQAQSQVN